MNLVSAFFHPFRRIRLRHVIIALLLVILAWRLIHAMLPMSVAEVLRHQSRLNNTVVLVWGVVADEGYYRGDRPALGIRSGGRNGGASLELHVFGLNGTISDEYIGRHIGEYVVITGVYNREGTPSEGYKNNLDVTSGSMVRLRGVKRFLVMHL